MFKKISSPVIILPYLTICGAGYHMSFWNEFGLNGLNFISLPDIIKSAAQPISFPVWTFLLAVFLAYFFTYAFLLQIKIPVKSLSNRTTAKFSLWYLPSLVIWIAIVVFIVMYFDDPRRWLAASGLASIPFMAILFFNGFLAEDVPNFIIRVYAVHLIVLLPFLSYSSGKMEADYIRKNLKYKYSVTPIINDSGKIEKDTVKLVGFTTDNVVFSSLNNKQIFILDRNLDTLSLQSKDLTRKNLIWYLRAGD